MDGFEVLDKLNNEELGVLVNLIVDKGFVSEFLSTDESYQKYYPDHKMYVDKIKEELSTMGGNTMANTFRTIFTDGPAGISYREMLMDVCDKLKIGYDSNDDDESIENYLLASVLNEGWEDMSSEQQAIFLGTVKDDNIPMEINKFSWFVRIFKFGGFESYKLSVIVANSVSKIILGKGLSFATNAALTKGLSVLVGPVAAVLSAFWTVQSFAGPAYRVTIPAVVYIAAMRKVKEHDNPSLKTVLGTAALGLGILALGKLFGGDDRDKQD